MLSTRPAVLGPIPPPEAPPPYGIPWLRTLYDYLDIGAFTMTAMMAFSVLLLNVVMIPVIINQTRGVRRRIKRAKWELKMQSRTHVLRWPSPIAHVCFLISGYCCRRSA